jgi:hypothetical protein
MYAIQHTLVSQDLLDKYFVCDLSACKGACCVKGDSGAPLDDEEAGILEDILDLVLPYMDDEGRAAVAEKGVFEIDVDGDMGTTLIADGRCAFATIEPDGMVICGIERAHADGKVGFKKPVSCHLYPIRIKSYADYDAVNYDRWDICKPACTCGSKLEVPLFRFVKAALIRKYGEAWFAELEELDEELRKQGIVR